MTERICDVCGKPDPSDAIARQQEQMRPREVKEGLVRIAHRNPFLALHGHVLPDIQMGDIAHVRLISGGVEDITAGFYCECEETA